jgi:hypothetical protein
MAMNIRCLIITAVALPSIISAHEPRLIGFLQGENSADQLGWHSEGIGDINGDGLGDFIVCQERNPEKMMIYLGGSNPFDSPPVLTILDYNNPKYVGDIDCDGVGDFLAVSPSGDTMRLYLGLESLDADDFLEFYVDDTVDYDYGEYRVSWGGITNPMVGLIFWFPERIIRTTQFTVIPDVIYLMRPLIFLYLRIGILTICTDI